MTRPVLTKAVLKGYLDKNSEYTLEEREEVKRYLVARVECRRAEIALKSDLKKTLAPYLNEDFYALIGVVEKQLSEGFYNMNINEVKHHKHVPKSNYMDYLSVEELTGLKYLRCAMIKDLRDIRDYDAGLDKLCYSATRIGKGVRKWFIEKYGVTPEDMPAEKLSYTCCVSKSKKLEKVINELTEKPREVQKVEAVEKVEKAQKVANTDCVSGLTQEDYDEIEAILAESVLSRRKSNQRQTTLDEFTI